VFDVVENIKMDHQFQEDSYQPLSPATGAESLFLAGLTSAHISAEALATQLRTTPRSWSSVTSLNTVATDDFLSAVETMDSLDSDEENYNNSNTTIPELQSQPFFDDENDDYSQTNTMASIQVTTTTPTPLPPKKALLSPDAVEESSHPDAASQAYKGAKGVWAWGKSVPVVSSFMGLTEAMAETALGVTGNNLESVDQTILKPQFQNLDNGILNPAIEKVVEIVMGAAGKTEEFVKPIILTIMSPLIKNEAENPEVTN
jgi:hypothetical protein